MPDAAPENKLEPKDELESTSLMTLSDFMGWNSETESDTESKTSGDILLKKPPEVKTEKKFSYIEKVEQVGGTRSPNARH